MQVYNVILSQWLGNCSGHGTISNYDKPKMYDVYCCVCDKLRYLQHNCVGDTIVYHWDSDMASLGHNETLTHQMLRCLMHSLNVLIKPYFVIISIIVLLFEPSTSLQPFKKGLSKNIFENCAYVTKFGGRAISVLITMTDVVFVCWCFGTMFSQRSAGTGRMKFTLDISILIGQVLECSA